MIKKETHSAYRCHDNIAYENYQKKYKKTRVSPWFKGVITKLFLQVFRKEIKIYQKFKINIKKSLWKENKKLNLSMGRTYRYFDVNKVKLGMPVSRG